MKSNEILKELFNVTDVDWWDMTDYVWEKGDYHYKICCEERALTFMTWCTPASKLPVQANFSLICVNCKKYTHSYIWDKRPSAGVFKGKGKDQLEKLKEVYDLISHWTSPYSDKSYPLKQFIETFEAEVDNMSEKTLRKNLVLDNLPPGLSACTRQWNKKIKTPPECLSTEVLPPQKEFETFCKDLPDEKAYMLISWYTQANYLIEKLYENYEKESKNDEKHEIDTDKDTEIFIDINHVKKDLIKCCEKRELSASFHPPKTFTIKCRNCERQFYFLREFEFRGSKDDWDELTKKIWVPQLVRVWNND